MKLLETKSWNYDNPHGSPSAWRTHWVSEVSITQQKQEREREREIKFIGLLGDRGHRGPYSPYKPYNHKLYIEIIIFPQIYNPQSTGYN